MRILLVSTYELGHQPLHVASPAARLRAAGHEVEALDLAVEDFDESRVARCDGAAVSVPMHTAMRLGIDAVRRIKSLRPALPVVFYGLYAAAGRDAGTSIVDHAFVGEYEPALVAWADSLAGGPRPSPVQVELGRMTFLEPSRDLLPPLDRYARLEVGGERRLAGYVEATHGCRHRCRHCPVPVVYDGRLRTVTTEVVLSDVSRQVAAGARHITFGDPDFLNAPAHALRVLDAVHSAFPDVTFDVTVKVSHILATDCWDDIARRNVLFVVSAFETTDDRSLRLLDKGHTAADMARAVDVLRSEGIEIRPTWLPFLPWTRIDDVRDIFSFLHRHDLFGATDPVQLGLRLLLPAGSLLLGLPEVAARVGPFDAEALTYPWTAEDPTVDELQRRLAELAAAGAADGAEPVDVLSEQWRTVLEVAGDDPAAAVPGPVRSVPRLSESWFCCAEPTALQRDRVTAPTCGC